jgi:hypothetical protein
VRADLTAVPGAPPESGNSSYTSTTAEGGIRYNLTMGSKSQTQASADGSFALYVDAQPEATMDAFHPGYKAQRETFDTASPVEFRLKRSVSLTVNVRDTQGNPLPRLHVCALTLEGNSRSCTSGGQGSAQFTLEEAAYAILASAAGFATEEQERELTAAADGATTIDVALVPGAALVIRLVGQATAEGTKVMLVDPSGKERPRLIQNGTVDPATGDTRWETWTLAPGVWTVSIEADGEVFTKEVEVVPGPTIQVVLP